MLGGNNTLHPPIDDLGMSPCNDGKLVLSSSSSYLSAMILLMSKKESRHCRQQRGLLTAAGGLTVAKVRSENQVTADSDILQSMECIHLEGFRELVVHTVRRHSHIGQ